MFQHSDIKWIKTVKRDSGTDWAYMEHNSGDTFLLNFPDNDKWFPTNYNKAKVGEIIVLFQTINERGGAKTYLTHLVTPLLNNDAKYTSVGSFPYTRCVCVISKPDNPILKPNDLDFGATGQGQIVDINNVHFKVASNLSISQRIWDLFSPIQGNLKEEIKAIESVPLAAEEMTVTEGAERYLFKLHKYKERNGSIVAAAKDDAKRNNAFFCEACGFDFAKFYPSIGEGFIECHHRTPISQGGIRETRKGDLAMVCANCHRMLHRRKPDGTYYTVEGLQELIKANR